MWMCDLRAVFHRAPGRIVSHRIGCAGKPVRLLTKCLLLFITDRNELQICMCNQGNKEMSRSVPQTGALSGLRYAPSIAAHYHYSEGGPEPQPSPEHRPPQRYQPVVWPP